jgi:hypothetical protein
MKKIVCLMVGIALFTGCSNITPEQREKIVDLVIAGINVAEQVYIADAQTPKDKDYVLTDVDTNNKMEYQLTLAYKLLKENGKKYAMKETGETYELTLKHFVVRLLEHQSKGEETTKLCIKRATVKDGTITDLMYSIEQDDGTRIETDCPSCCDWLVD